MRTALTYAPAVLLILLGVVAAVIYKHQKQQPSDPAPAACDLFGQPVPDSGNAAPEQSFPPALPPGITPTPYPDSPGNTQPPSTQDLFIGPRQPFEPPEIIAYA